MKKLKTLDIVKIITILLVIFFLFIGFLMCVKNVEKSMMGFGPIDIARRVTSPNESKTAILVRSYASFLDLNFALYITDDQFADITDSEEDASFISDSELASLTEQAIWIRRALWISQDYEPTTRKNWREDVVWSEEGTVVAVTIEERYVFAYDILSGQHYEDPEKIRNLLEECGPNGIGRRDTT
jgi:hypothetical protein